MKKWLIGLTCMGLLAVNAMGGLIISQYYEGASNDKWIEIYNPGPSAVDMAAEGYRLGLWANDNVEGWKTNGAPTYPAAVLTNILPAGATFLYSHASAALPAYAVADMTGQSAWFNGDDTPVLFTGDPYDFANVVDVIGLQDSSAENEKSLVRTNTVTTGVNTDFNAADWIEYTLTEVEDATAGTNERLGYHSATPAGFNVAFDQADGFSVNEGSSAVITAIAAGGTEPYTYDWSSTLGGTYYSTNDDEFTILSTAPVGSYSATVVAEDATTDSVTNTINFSVETVYAITITTPTNGAVSTTPDAEATAGTTVSIQADPDPGYAVGTITVIDDSLNPITVTGNEFTMPADGVTVTVTFDVFTGSELYISEVADPSGTGGDRGRFVELYNSGDSSIDLAAGSWYLCKQVNGGNWSDVALTGTVAASETYVVAAYSDFSTLYPSAPAGNPDQINSNINGNGDDGYFLYSGGDHSAGTLEDAYGVIGEDGSGTDWDYEDSRANRNTSSTAGNPTWSAADWTITDPAVYADMTPGVYPDGPPVYAVNFDKADGFTVAFGASDMITATAVNGTEPYTYAWSSTLDTNHYLAVSNTFSILATAPVGNYSAEVVATDDASQMVTNTINFSVVLDIATIPVNESYSSTFDWLTLPGWSGTGMSTYSDGDMSFGASADTMTVNFDATPGDLTFDLQGRTITSGTAPAQFDIEESADGAVWTSVDSLDETALDTSAQTFGPYTLLGASRYVRWTYVNRYGFNIGLNDVMITSGGPAVFSVSFNRTNGFEVAEGTSDAITATAANGTEPYAYAWSSTLLTNYYTDVDNVFTILATAPTGSYSATVVATDDTAAEVTNTVDFVVKGAPPGAPYVTITGDLTNDVNEVLNLMIELHNEVAADWAIDLKDPYGGDVYTYNFDVPPAFYFTPTNTGIYVLTATALDGSFDPIAAKVQNLEVTVASSDPPIGPVTVVLDGSGDFTFEVPAGYDLVRVEGAGTVPLPSGEFDWTTLTENTDYTVSGSTVRILSTEATARMVRIVLTPSAPT